MANKRNLKHTINYVCGELFAECIAVSQYSSNPDNENVNALLRTILTINNDMIKRVSHPEPGMSAKKYYNELSWEEYIEALIRRIAYMNGILYRKQAMGEDYSELYTHIKEIFDYIDFSFERRSSNSAY